MTQITTREIEELFFQFFVSEGHMQIDPANLRTDDPTIHFVPAGMAPLKPYFTGEEKGEVFFETITTDSKYFIFSLKAKNI